MCTFLAVTVFNTLVKGSALAKISGLEWAEILAQIVYTCAGESETGGKRETCKSNTSTHRRSTYGHHRAHSVLNFMQDWSFTQSQPVASQAGRTNRYSSCSYSARDIQSNAYICQQIWMTAQVHPQSISTLWRGSQERKDNDFSVQREIKGGKKGILD